jgi:hypothetical protein
LVNSCLARAHTPPVSTLMWWKGRGHLKEQNKHE